jgi:hypothetical protein
MKKLLEQVEETYIYDKFKGEISKPEEKKKTEDKELAEQMSKRKPSHNLAKVNETIKHSKSQSVPTLEYKTSSSIPETISELAHEEHEADQEPEFEYRSDLVPNEVNQLN